MGHGYSFGGGAAGWRAPRSRTVSNRSRASGRWLTMTTLRPSVAESTSSRTAVAVAWSRCAVGSSSSTTGRSASTARATPSRARSPPDRPRPPLPSRGLEAVGQVGEPAAEPGALAAPARGPRRRHPGRPGAGWSPPRRRTRAARRRRRPRAGARRRWSGGARRRCRPRAAPGWGRGGARAPRAGCSCPSRWARRRRPAGPGVRCRSVGASCSPWPVHEAATPSRSTRRPDDVDAVGHGGRACRSPPAPGRAAPRGAPRCPGRGRGSAWCRPGAPARRRRRPARRPAGPRPGGR